MATATTTYLLSVHHDYDAAPPSEEETQRMFDAVDEFNHDLQGSGAWVFAGGLHAPSSATTVDNTGSEVLTTDGPFAEAKEVLGGFWIIRVADLDAALEVAASASQACGGPVEVRPFEGDVDGDASA